MNEIGVPEIRLFLMLFAVICVAANSFLPFSPVFDFGLHLYRKWGWTRLADTWEKRKTWWLPLNRVILGVLAIVSIVALYLLKQ